MHRIVTGATGLIGKRLVEHWLDEGHVVTVIGRSEQHMHEVFASRVKVVTWDGLTRDLLASAEVVVNLAGASVGEQRWSDARKREILASRTKTTATIATLLAQLGEQAPPFFNASAVGIYGLQAQMASGLPPRLDEGTLINWEHPADFLAQVGCQWEQAAAPAIAAGVRVVFLRFGVVLAKEGGALPQIMMPFKFFMGGPVGTGRQAFSWVAIEDVIRAIDFLLTKPEAAGPYNVIAPECVTQRAFAETLGSVMHRPAFVPMPAFVLKIMLGAEMAQALLLEGQNVYPARLQALGFQFKYPTLRAAIQSQMA